MKIHIENPMNAAPRPEEEDDLIGRVVGERYRVLELIGRGGMGNVYRAEQIHMKRIVALKVLHREMTALSDVVARFEREAVAAGRIHHPNVARAVDFGRLDTGAYYLALEYVNGKTLAELIASARFPVERSARIIRQVALALEAAHGAGVIHRDLKPDNIMVSENSDGTDTVKVLDFGIAKLASSEVGKSEQAITQIGSVFGTPEYMAPEQAAGQAVDQRADLYSTGLLFYRLLAGRPPFRSESVSSVLAMQITQPPPPLPQTVDPEIVSLVMRLLEKNPDDRIQTPQEVVSRLSAFLGVPSIGVESQPPPPADSVPPTPGTPVPARKEFARSLVLLALGTLVVLIGVAVLARRGPNAHEAEGASRSSRELTDSERESLTARALATEDPKAAAQALKVAAERLGPSGADLLFAVWTSSGGAPSSSNRELAGRLVRTPAVRKHASPALDVAISLQEAKTCDRAVELLPKVVRYGDRRSVDSLKRLREESNCDPPGGTLDAALAAASKRLPPRLR